MDNNKNEVLTNEAIALNKILHFNTLDNVVYGEYKGYLFSIYINKPGKATLFIQIDTVPSEDAVANSGIKPSHKVYLRELGKSFCAYLDLSFDLNSEAVKDDILKELDELTALFKATSTTQKDKCMLCGKKCSTNHVVQGFNIYIHDDCWKQQRIESVERMKKWNKYKKRFPLAIVVSLLFNLIGLVPALLLAGFAQIQLAALYILGPICGFLGYKLCHTVDGYFRKFTISITSGVSGIVMYMLTCLWMSKIVNPPISFVEALNANIGFFMQIIMFLVLTVILVNMVIAKLKVFRNKDEEFYSSWK